MDKIIGPGFCRQLFCDGLLDPLAGILDSHPSPRLMKMALRAAVLMLKVCSAEQLADFGNFVVMSASLVASPEDANFRISAAEMLWILFQNERNVVVGKEVNAIVPVMNAIKLFPKEKSVKFCYMAIENMCMYDVPPELFGIGFQNLTLGALQDAKLGCTAAILKVVERLFEGDIVSCWEGGVVETLLDMMRRDKFERRLACAHAVLKFCELAPVDMVIALFEEGLLSDLCAFMDASSGEWQKRILTLMEYLIKTDRRVADYVQESEMVIYMEDLGHLLGSEGQQDEPFLP
jgi:hypothetical protein